MVRFAFILFLSSALLFAACDSPRAEQSYEDEVIQERVEKDMRFRDRERSVLTLADLEDFTGLRYFDVDKDYRFELELREDDGPEKVWMEQRVGGPIEQERVGYIEVPFPEGTQRLDVFKPSNSSSDSTLWLPFSDETTGETTYAAGRYLDLPVKSDGTVLADFNRAYNPLCDYNPDEYNCSLPPSENDLAIAVEVGEKKSKIRD